MVTTSSFPMAEHGAARDFWSSWRKQPRRSERWQSLQKHRGTRRRQRIPTAALIPSAHVLSSACSCSQHISWLGSSALLGPGTGAMLPLLLLERSTRNHSSTSFFLSLEVAHEGKKLQESPTLCLSPLLPSLLAFCRPAPVSLRCVGIVVVHSKSSSSNMQRNEAGSSDGPQRTRLLHKSPFHSLFAKNFNTKLNCKVAY